MTDMLICLTIETILLCICVSKQLKYAIKMKEYDINFSCAVTLDLILLLNNKRYRDIIITHHPLGVMEYVGGVVIEKWVIHNY